MHVTSVMCDVCHWRPQAHRLVVHVPISLSHTLSLFSALALPLPMIVKLSQSFDLDDVTASVTPCYSNTFWVVNDSGDGGVTHQVVCQCVAFTNRKWCGDPGVITCCGFRIQIIHRSSYRHSTFDMPICMKVSIENNIICAHVWLCVSVCFCLCVWFNPSMIPHLLRRWEYWLWVKAIRAFAHIVLFQLEIIQLRS